MVIRMFVTFDGYFFVNYFICKARFAFIDMNKRVSNRHKCLFCKIPSNYRYRGAEGNNENGFISANHDTNLNRFYILPTFNMMLRFS